MKYPAIIILFLLSNLVFGQNSNEIQTMLAGHLKKIAYYKYDVPNDDSVDIENTHFKKLFLTYISEHPSTLTSNLSIVVKAGLMIASSADSMFRIYSWDTERGGTMRFYDNVYQFKSGNTISFQISTDDTAGIGDPLSWYSEIYTLDDGGKRYYLGVYNADYSNRDKAQGIRFFTIKNDVLNTDVKLAKTKEGISNGLGVGYNFFTLQNHNERPLKLVLYNPDKKTISVPIVAGDSLIENKFTVYKFTNGYFEETK